MFFTEFFVALFFSILTGIIFASKGYRGPWEPIWVYFVLLFLFTWTSGAWITPMGPTLFGIYWLPFLYFAVIFSLIMAAISPRRRPFKWKTTQEKKHEVQEMEIAAAVTMNIFLWLLLISFLVSIILRYRNLS